MFTLDFRGGVSGEQRLIFIVDDEGVLRWSGPTLIGAMRYLAEWGQEHVIFDVDSTIWFLG